MIERRGVLKGLAGAGIGLGLACAHSGAPSASRSFVQRRAGHRTVLEREGPSPGKWRERQPPEGAEAVHYPSEVGPLLAYYAAPDVSKGPAAALVYFHGEFSLHPADFDRVRPFVDAGFAVMTPSLRGENGNPGRFELLYGELDDARAAITWLLDQEGVDASRVFALGHSVGGALSALLSLDARTPLVSTASAGGIYVPETFVRWRANPKQSNLVRFDPSIADERELRALGPHVAQMARPHIAYVGDADRAILRNARTVAAAATEHHTRFSVEVVPGDHGSMIEPAVAAYLELAQRG